MSDFNARVGNTEWCLCGENCAAICTADECFCYQELDALNKKIDKSMVECITRHSKFWIECLNTDVLHTALACGNSQHVM